MDTEPSTIKISGILVGLDIDIGSFHFVVPDGTDFRGGLSDDFVREKTTIGDRYLAVISEKIKRVVATGKEGRLLKLVKLEREQSQKAANHFGRARLRFSHTHCELLVAANRDPQSRYGNAATVLRTHVRVLLATAGTTGDLDAQTDALLALLEADYVEYQLRERDQSLQALGDAWESLARKLCGR